MAALPAVLLQHRHHGLGEGVHRELIDPLCQPLAPVLAMLLQVALQVLAFHVMATMVAVAHVIRAFDGRKWHDQLLQGLFSW